MYESLEKKKEQFRFPDIEAERGEFERVATKFGVDCGTLMFLAREEGILVDLRDEVWSGLDNTDSRKFEKGDWNSVKQWSNEYNRDWMILREKMENGHTIDTPFVIRIDGMYHLVSGNTRLMVARALGVTPKVLLFTYTHD